MKKFKIKKIFYQWIIYLLKYRVFSKGSGDIFIWGMIDRNRAIHGDEVVVEMYPEAQWKSRCMTLNENPYEGGLY